MTEYANKKRSKGPDLKKGGMVYLLRRNIKTKRSSDKLNHIKLGPFKIKDKKGPVIYELKLPKGMRIHLTFHVSLLESASKDARLEPIEIDEEIQQPYYEIDKIIGTKLSHGKPYYLIYWKGY